ncbi:hypothetical protein QUF74_09600 [Candidatus Halobeggiatoa sp. HSG11]|nr:hypothetical protein [Candidatus Halobeggiatoa sp. HSG11]
MKKIMIGILFSVLISTLVNAQEVTKEQQEVTKEQWVSVMKTRLPAHFCQAEQYFRQCFNVVATECEEVAASTMNICLSELNNQIPNVLIQPKDGSLWGTKVGSCAGIAYETSLIKKRISNDKCNNISNWQ